MQILKACSAKKIYFCTRALTYVPKKFAYIRKKLYFCRQLRIYILWKQYILQEDVSGERNISFNRLRALCGPRRVLQTEMTTCPHQRTKRFIPIPPAMPRRLRWSLIANKCRWNSWCGCSSGRLIRCRSISRDTMSARGTGRACTMFPRNRNRLLNWFLKRSRRSILLRFK